MRLKDITFQNKIGKNLLNAQSVFVVSAEGGCAPLAALHKTLSRLHDLPLLVQEHGQRRKACQSVGMVVSSQPAKLRVCRSGVNFPEIGIALAFSV